MQSVCAERAEDSFQTDAECGPSLFNPWGGDRMCFDDLSGHLHVTLHKGLAPL